MSDNAAINVECPECEKRLRVPASAAGKRIRCPNCNHVLEVPAETGTTAEPPKARPKPRPPEPEPESEPDSYDEPARERDDDDDDDDDIRVRRKRRRGPGGAFMAAAISMLVIAGLALLLDLFNCVFAVVGAVPPVNPQEPAFLQEIQKNSRGPLAAAMQGVLAILAGVTIIGSIQMLRQKTYGLAITACVLSMIHIGSCCCALGLPVGIWGIIMLMNPEVKDSFS